MDIKPIETRYKGNRFRSRTEARWAVCFDSLNIPYEYEKEGYELESGWYLPDFWLPQQQCFFEVKGGKYNQQEKTKAIELLQKTTYPVLIAEGPPDFKLEKKEENLVRIVESGHAFFIGRELDIEKIQKDVNGFTEGFEGKDEFFQSLHVMSYTDRNKGAFLCEYPFFVAVAGGSLSFVIDDAEDKIVPYRQIAPQKFEDYYYKDNVGRVKQAKKYFSSLDSLDSFDESKLCSVSLITKMGVIKQMRQGLPFIYSFFASSFLQKNISSILLETKEFLYKGKSARFEHGECG